MSFRVPDSPGSTSSATPSSRPESSYWAEERFGPQQGAMVNTEMGDGPTVESVLTSLSPEQRKTLEVMLLASNKKPEKIAAVGADKLQKWPEWNGEPSSFLLYFHRLKGKIEADKGKMGNDAAICNQIIGTIPEDKQQRVAHWFISGGDDGQFDIDDFLELI